MNASSTTKTIRHFPLISSAITFAVGLSLSPLLSGQTVYLDDGETSGLEEEVRWLANRARFNPARENQIRRTFYSGLPSTSQPMASNFSLIQAARHHSEDLATHNKVGHPTVQGSFYYDPKTQPDFPERALAEGYTLWGGAELINYQDSTGVGHHVDWWNSALHRQYMLYPDWRECGPGYFHLAGSQWGHYCTVVMSGTWYQCYFTGTIFHDRNNNGSYQDGEGIQGVEVKLKIDGEFYPIQDQSAPAGNFALPLHYIKPGSTIQVILENNSSQSISLNIPRNYDTLDEITIPAGAAIRIGSFSKSTTTLNVGFRNIAPEATPLVTPSLSITRMGTQVELRWDSHSGVDYLLQWTEDLITWTDDSKGYQEGIENVMISHQALTAGSRRFFRVVTR